MPSRCNYIAVKVSLVRSVCLVVFVQRHTLDFVNCRERGEGRGKMSFVAGVVLLGWGWGWICIDKMERGGGVIVGVGICGRMVEILFIFSLIRFCSSTTSRRTSIMFFISSCKRAACIKTNVHVSGKMKSGKSAVSVMHAYLRTFSSSTFRYLFRIVN